MDWVAIYDGPTVLADMLRQELRERGVRAAVYAAGPFLGIIGDAARSPYSVVKVLDEELALHKDAIEECLALVGSDPAVSEEELNAPIDPDARL
jgi:hypothetical protein